MRQAPKISEVYRYPVVAGTALIAIAVTLAWWAKVDVSPLFENAMIRRGETWRLVTSIFPHAGILHLAFNLYWLWVFGSLIEETYGHLKTAALIVLLAFSSGAWEYALAVGGFGLSGVVYGFFGLLWVLSKRDGDLPDAIDSRTVQLFVGWFFLCIATTLLGVMPVGNVAHGAGAVVGILVGLAITTPQKRTLMTASVAAILLLGFWGATLWRPRVNLSGKAGYEESIWGYNALLANKNQEAVRWLRDAVSYQPKTSAYWSRLGFAYLRIGDNSNGVSAYRRAADLGDAQAQLYLGSLYEAGNKGLPKDDAQALDWYRRAADRGDAGVLNNLAWTFATSSDPTIRNAPAALVLARRAVELGKEHPVAAHLYTLAEALYANRNYEAAVTAELEAIALVPDPKKNYYEKQLDKYREALNDKNQRPAK
jgi:GlpG protein